MDHMMTEEHILTHCLTYPVGSRHKHVVSALTEVRMKGNRLWMHVQLEQGNVHHSCMHNTFKSISKVHSSNVIKGFKSPMTLSVNMPLV